MYEAECCEASKPNHEPGSREFVCDGKRITCDYKVMNFAVNWPVALLASRATMYR